MVITYIYSDIKHLLKAYYKSGSVFEDADYKTFHTEKKTYRQEKSHEAL